MMAKTQFFGRFSAERGGTGALLGLVFALAGTFVFPFFLIPGLIFSIFGLRSKSYFLMALSGLIVSIIVLILWTIIVVELIVAGRAK
jgi:hypothetical protein